MSLFPTVKDCLTVHDAAHEAQSAELHGTALKLMALCGQSHVKTDTLDETVAESFPGLPGAVCLDAECAALLGNQLVTRDKAVAEQLASQVAGVERVLHDANLEYKRRTPAYGLWLVRAETQDEIEPECAFQCGEYVPVGKPRHHGAYRFPIVAQRVSPGYRMLQVHKHGDDVTVFEKGGEYAFGLADVVDTFVGLDQPESLIVECLYAEGRLELFDVLMMDGVDMTKIGWQDRNDLLVTVVSQRWPEGLESATIHTFHDQKELHGLEPGTYLVRYRNEVLDDLMRPYWFVYESGKVQVGTVLPWVKPSAAVSDASGYLTVQDHGLPPLQLHHWGQDVKIFVANGARNRVRMMPQVADKVRELSENCIMECMWTCTRNGAPVSVETIRNAWHSLADCEITLYPYDLVLWGDTDLTNQPMYERVEMLERVTVEWEDVALAVVDKCDNAWLFVADSVRPLDGSNDHCFRTE